MSDVPTAKQSMRSIIVKLFPWIGGVVSVVGAKGKGLAIRTASGLLHLAGGPDDPAVHRVGDRGTAGTVEVTVDQTGLVFKNANNEEWRVTIAFVGGAVVVGPSVPPGPFQLITKATTGSERVTSA